MKKISLQIDVARSRRKIIRRRDEVRVAIGVDRASNSCRERLQNRINSARRAGPSASRVVASSPDQKCKSNDQNQDNQHPVLAFDSKNVKWLNEELHRYRPFVVQPRGFDAEKILFIYSPDVARF
jgi:hypothetical protein